MSGLQLSYANLCNNHKNPSQQGRRSLGTKLNWKLIQNIENLNKTKWSDWLKFIILFRYVGGTQQWWRRFCSSCMGWWCTTGLLFPMFSNVFILKSESKDTSCKIRVLKGVASLSGLWAYLLCKLFWKSIGFELFGLRWSPKGLQIVFSKDQPNQNQKPTETNDNFFQARPTGRSDSGRLFGSSYWNFSVQFVRKNSQMGNKHERR